MLDLKAATHEHFAACLNQSFTINDAAAGALELELVEVSSRGQFDPQVQSRQPFSLLFRGPEEPVMPQHLYHIRHAQLGEMVLFLVPIGPDRAGMRYEAVFT